jgi:hypothetical protein
MEIARRIVLLPVSALILMSILCCVLPSSEVLAADSPLLRLATTAPAERPSQPPTWADDLERQLSTYLKKKYPAYDFTPYTEELERVRDAVSRGNRWAVKREMGVFLKMLVSRAHGLGDDAAEELTKLAQQTMPAEEFAIVYPGSITESHPVWISA